MSRPLRTLIVEDNPHDAELVLGELRRAGFEPVWQRVDTEEAYLDHLHADLEVILSDYQMPQFSGLRALKLLKERGLEIPFIIVSGTIGEDTAVEAMKEGAADYLLKDRLARLGPAIEHAMEEGRLRRERKQAEDALRLFRSLVDQSNDTLEIIDPETARFLDVNEKGPAELGCSRAEYLSLRVIDIDPTIAESDWPQLAERIRGAGSLSGEGRHRRKNGTTFPIEFNAKWVRLDREYIVAVIRDVTERKRAEEALRWKTAFFEAQVDCSLDGILVVDGQGRKILQNERLNELWKIPPHIAESGDDAARLRFITSQARNPRQFADRVAYLYAHPDEIGQDEIELVDGTILDRYSAPVRARDGTYYGRILTFHDVTEERHREEKLSESLAREKELLREAQAGNRAKRDFLAVMSHEIRTPINGILGFSELLAGTPGLPADCRDYVETIISSGSALLRILNDILDFCCLEAGGLKVEKALLSPREILEDIRMMLALRAREKHLEFHVSIADAVPERLWNDAGRLRQILLNLAGNAIKFTEHGSITLGLRPSLEALDSGEAGVDFFVRDTGPGIPEEEREHIFEPFAQVDPSISRRHGGTGLGLSISRNLAKLMGAKLVVLSEADVGSEFYVTLPVGLPENTMPAVPDSDGEVLDETFAANHPMSILLVEDDRVNLKLMSMMLRKLGYEPLIAQDGIEAVEIYRRGHPDCILMDLQMPRKDGLQATLEIREIENSTPGGGRAFIAALTANIVAENRRQCFEVGMDEYLNKPIKGALLAKTLGQASEARGRSMGVDAPESRKG